MEIGNNFGKTLNDATIGASGFVESKSLGQADFLKLMVEQLRNQNPLEPQDNSQFFSQIVQFDTLDAMQEISSALQTLVVVSELANASALVGRTVTAEVPQAPDPETGYPVIRSWSSAPSSASRSRPRARWCTSMGSRCRSRSSRRWSDGRCDRRATSGCGPGSGPGTAAGRPVRRRAEGLVSTQYSPRWSARSSSSRSTPCGASSSAGCGSTKSEWNGSNRRWDVRRRRGRGTR